MKFSVKTTRSAEGIAVNYNLLFFLSLPNVLLFKPLCTDVA